VEQIKHSINNMLNVEQVRFLNINMMIKHSINIIITNRFHNVVESVKTILNTA
jgi:hypothetical protein